MRREEEGVILGVEPDEHRAQERAAGEVEGARELFDAARFEVLWARGGGDRGEVSALEADRVGGADELSRALGPAREGGAQRLVAGDDGVEALLEGGNVEEACQAQGAREVVGAGRRGELVEEPEALLGEGERDRGRARAREEGHDGHARGGGEAGRRGL